MNLEISQRDNYEYLNEIKAKPTVYKGIHFKSKLEAQWAAFFDELNLSWQYEKDTFPLPDGRVYVSDFTVQSEYGYAVYEIKPAGIKSPKFKAAQELFYFGNTWLNYEAYWESHDLAGEDWIFSQMELLNGSILDHYFTAWAHLQICFRCGLPQSTSGLGTERRYNDGVGCPVGRDEFDFPLCYNCDVNTPFGGGNDPEYSFATNLYYRPHKGYAIISEADWEEYIKKLDTAALRVTTSDRLWE